MLKITMTVGIPGSGKSTWAKDEIRKDPEGTVRINRDDLRTMLFNYHFSDSNEKIVTSTKEHLLIQSLRKGRNVIIDETNINRRNFGDLCSLVSTLNIDCMVIEKSFYVDLDEAIARDAQRTGTSKVGEDVVRKFWKKSGGTQHKFYKPRVEMISKNSEAMVAAGKPVVDPKLPWAIMCDLDGTLSLFNAIGKDGSVSIRHEGTHARSPYDASKCDEDTINEQVAGVIEALHKTGYKVIFCSGREDCYRAQTIRFIEKHLSVPYELFMRVTHDQRKDSIIKGEIYENKIVPNYNIFLVLDDRATVVDEWRRRGLVCFQVAPGNF